MQFQKRPGAMARANSPRSSTRQSRSQALDWVRSNTGSLSAAIAGRLAAMAEHKFKIGQFVYFQPQWPGHALPSRYPIVRRLREFRPSFTT